MSTPTVHQDSLGRFQVITERGASWSPDPPSVRELHEARARELQREAVASAVHRVTAWLRRANPLAPCSCGPHAIGPGRPPVPGNEGKGKLTWRST